MLNEKPFKIYRSSAGSGKTYTLVKEYILILLNSEDAMLFKKILAITFTNKAANEMKSRILEALKKLASSEKSDLMTDYLTELSIGESEVKKRSKWIFKNILHNYGEFNVLTIDKFIHRIIRSFTRELGLAMNFELESDTRLFISRSIEMLLSEVGEDKDLTKYLIRFSEQLIDNSEKGTVEKELQNLSQVLEKEEGKEAVEELQFIDLQQLIVIQKKITEKIQQLKSQLIKEGEKIMTLLTSQGIEIGDLARGKNGVGKVFLELSKGNFAVKETVLLKQLEKDVWSASSISISKKEAILSISSELRESSLKAIELLREYKIQFALNKNFVGFSLLTTIQKTLQEIKDKSNIVFLNDFNEIISSVVRNEPAPFIYEKIGNRYQYFLIDEFQDTSKLQWHNLVPLIYDSLSNGHKNLVVGDAKQAIYRWRGGDVRQFVELPKVNGDFHDLAYINRTLESSHTIENLENNFRSWKKIVEFNNWVFERYAGEVTNSKLIKLIYEGGTQQAKKEQEGYVKYNILQGSKEDVKEERFDKLLASIKETLDDGFTHKDIAILVKTNTNGREIAEFLEGKGIPVISGDSVVLGKSEEVNFLVSFLEYYQNRENQQAVIKCLQFLQKESEHLTFLHEKWRVPAKSKEYFTKSIDFSSFIKENYPRFNYSYFDKLNLYDKLIFLIEVFNLNRFDAYLDQMLNTVQNYTKKNASSLNEFITYYNDNKDKIPVNGGDNSAIQITTIHKSKGLEFPVVIIPFADWQDKNNQFTDYAWVAPDAVIEYGLPKYVLPVKSELENYGLSEVYEKEKEETEMDNINLFYVAFTRAGKRMYVISSRKPTEKTASNVYQKLNLLVMSHPNYDTEENHLVFGKREKNEISGKEITVHFSEPPTVKTWRGNLSLSLDKNALESDITEIDEREYGNAVHYILSQITNYKTIDEVIEQAITKQIVSEKIKTKIKTDIEKCFQDERIKKWFFDTGIQVINEQAIVDETGITHRPDRVMIKGKQALVVDYKTGKKRTTHQKQLKEYGELLSELGYPNPELYLLYTATQEVVQIA